jgi:REP element-mobilizing transposase RayT
VFRQLKFSGLKAVAWCCMGNHFHLLLEVPDKESSLVGWKDEDLLERLKVLREEGHTWALLKDIEMWRKNGNRDGIAKVAASVRKRLFDLSQFMKELKQKFTSWFNKRHHRKGTLWEERFRSVLLEGPEISELENHAVKVVAAYIDLNPVRAGLVEDPKDYRWCGYAAAVAGDKEARRGVAKAMGCGAGAGLKSRWRWSAVSAGYRRFLYISGGEHGAGETGAGRHVKARHGFSRSEAERVLKGGGNLALCEAIHCRLRYASDGVVLGSRAFLDDFFEKRKEMFGPARTSGARKMKGADWEGLMSIRDLGKGAVSV